MTLTEYSQLILNPKDLDQKASPLKQWWKQGPAGVKSLNFGIEINKENTNQKPDNIRLICEMNDFLNSDPA